MPDSVIRRPLKRMDPERPWHPFLEDGSIYTVDSYPAIMPILGVQDGFDSLLRGVIYAGLWRAAGRLLDPRWKMVVSRRPVVRATMFHAVHIEFYDSGEETDTRIAEMARDWRRGQFSDAVPFTAHELARARRESRRGAPIPQAQALQGFSLTTLRSRFFLSGGASGLALGLLALGVGLWLHRPVALLGALALIIAVPFLAAGSVLWLIDRERRGRLRRPRSPS